MIRVHGLSLVHCIWALILGTLLSAVLAWRPPECCLPPSIVFIVGAEHYWMKDKVFPVACLHA